MTVATRAVSDLTRQYLPFFVMPGSSARRPARRDRAAVRAPPGSRLRPPPTRWRPVLGARDPAYWASVAPVVAAIPGGGDVYRDSLDRAGRFEWDQTARALRARAGDRPLRRRPGAR